MKWSRAVFHRRGLRRSFAMYAKYIKRMLDFLIALVGLVVASPILLIVAVLVRTKLGSPVLFAQERPGKDEKIFKLYKFRSMSDARDEQGNLLPDKDRLTPFGKMLRATSLDELPELFNILKGDMSLIGPRPLLVSYLPWYTEREQLRHTVRPGLTGLAQVSGRNSLVWDKRLEKDVEYVEHLSFMMDLKILFMTVKKVVCKDDVAEYTNEIEGNFAEISKQQKMREEISSNKPMVE